MISSAAIPAALISGGSLPRAGTARPAARAHRRISAAGGSGASGARASPVVAAAATGGPAGDWPAKHHRHVSEPELTVRAGDQPSWAEVLRHAEHGESVPVIARGVHVADVVPSGELERLRETIEALSDSELVHDLREGLADARAGRVFSAGQIAADLSARRTRGE